MTYSRLTFGILLSGSYGRASPGKAQDTMNGAGPADTSAAKKNKDPSYGPLRRQRCMSTGHTYTRHNRYFRITVRDNGIGMPHNEVPNMLARVLSGSKYGIQQARGRFGSVSLELPLNSWCLV